MNKKTTLGIIAILLILFSIIIHASTGQILAYWVKAKNGEWAIEPICATGATQACEAGKFAIDPQGNVQGQGLSAIGESCAECGEALTASISPEGYVTQKVLEDAAEKNPEAAGDVSEALALKSQLAELGVEDDSKNIITRDGEVTKAEFTAKEEGDIGNIVGKDLNKEDIRICKDTQVQKEEGVTTLTTTEGCSGITIKGITFSNIQEGGTLKLDEQGNVLEADFTTTGDCQPNPCTYELGGEQIKAYSDTRVVYKDGEFDAYGPGKTVEIGDKKIEMHGESIHYDGEKITGTDFTVNEVRFTGAEKGGIATAKVTEKGIVVGENTKAKSQRYTVTTQKRQEVLLANMCEEVSGYDNYVNPCKGKLTMAGRGFSVGINEGRNFGLNVPKDAELRFDMEGGQVEIEEGAALVTLNQKGDSIKVTNGEVITNHKYTAQGVQVTTDPESIGKDPDVTDLKTSTGPCSIETTEEGAMEVYYCPEDSSPTTRAILYLTGMAEAEKKSWGDRLREKCSKFVETVQDKVPTARETTKKIDDAVNSLQEGYKDYKEGKLGPKIETGSDMTFYPNSKEENVDWIKDECDGCEYDVIDAKDASGDIYQYAIVRSPDVGYVEGTSGVYVVYEDGTLGDRVEIFNDHDQEALGIVPPQWTGDVSKITPPEGELEYFSNGIWYMKDGNIWRTQPDGSVVCVNC